MLTSSPGRSDNAAMGRAERAAAEQPFDELIQHWLATLATTNTRDAYAVDLARFGQWCVAQQAVPFRADPATIVAFHAAQQAAGHSVATQRRRWSALSSFYQYALDNGIIDTNPAATSGRPRLPADATSSTIILHAEDVDAYLAAAEAFDPRLDALVSLIVFDGLKLGEALALDIDDVRGRTPNMTIRVRRRNGDRRVKLQARSARAVSRCVGRRSDEPLFTGPPRGGVTHRLTRFGADHLLKKLATTGTPISANALRRFHITTHHATGADLDNVRTRAGLDDIRTVRRLLPDRVANQSNTDQPRTYPVHDDSTTDR